MVKDKVNYKAYSEVPYSELAAYPAQHTTAKSNAREAAGSFKPRQAQSQPIKVIQLNLRAREGISG